jgi:mRNA-degrading endonuclease RelE of RelBE toxin-antitoxin system
MRLILQDNFIREVKKFPLEIRQRVKDKLLLVEKNPFNEIQKLGGFNLYKTRVGKYRIILIVDFQKSCLYPMTMDLRKNVYKNLTKKKEKELFKKVEGLI